MAVRTALLYHYSILKVNRSRQAATAKSGKGGPCCRCNGKNARCRLCACVKVDRPCVNWLPGRDRCCSNNNTTSTLPAESLRQLHVPALNPPVSQCSNSQQLPPFIQQLQISSQPTNARTCADRACDVSSPMVEQQSDCASSPQTPCNFPIRRFLPYHHAIVKAHTIHRISARDLRAIFPGTVSYTTAGGCTVRNNIIRNTSRGSTRNAHHLEQETMRSRGLP